LATPSSSGLFPLLCLLFLSVVLAATASNHAVAEDLGQERSGAEEQAKDDSIAVEKFAIGFRAGINDNLNEEIFRKYEFLFNYTLPWAWHSKSGWILASRLDFTAAALNSAGTTGFLGSLGPALLVTRQGGRLLLELGISPAYLSQDIYGKEDMSGNIQFFTHGGVSLRIIRSLWVGYEFQHISNAGIEQPNPGLNMHCVQIAYSIY
jgi:lipid A 3-O-deacylase